jgi:hypothetical protein
MAKFSSSDYASNNVNATYVVTNKSTIIDPPL